jgi:hypothetical protein
MHPRGTPSKLKRLLREETGQTLVFVLLCLTGVIGLAGISMDMGHGFYAYEELKASTNAAAMAGAEGLPDTGTATSNVTAYSSATGDHNYTPIFSNVTTTVSFECYSALTNIGMICTTASGSTGGYNAVQVKQSAQVQTWFAKMFGVSSFNLNATSTAAKAGGTNTPWNIAIILDTTASMAAKDSGVQCSGTQISCALLGVQALLADLSPCALNTTCTSSTSPVDSVSLFVFPPVLGTTASKDYGNGSCPTSAPTHEWYEVPTLPTTWTYQIVPFSNDYRTTDATTGLDSASDIVIAAGGAGCSGISAPGGAGTYYAQAIYAAETALEAQQKANPGSQNAMIILSDGDATSTVTYTDKTDTAITSTSELQPSATKSLNGVAFNNPTSYTYPSAVGECGQAVQAAQKVASSPNGNNLAGTVVYTIGYGAETSGCTTDSKYSGSYTSGWSSWGPGDSPCQALMAMASNAQNFFSDDGDGCASVNQANFTQLTSIFHVITSNLSAPRIIPNGG